MVKYSKTTTRETSPLPKYEGRKFERAERAEVKKDSSSTPKKKEKGYYSSE